MPPAHQAVFTALRDMPSLGELDHELVDKLSRVGEVQVLQAGTILFAEGHRHQRIYLVSSGAIRLEMLTAKCGRQTILSIGGGDFLAWSALIGDGVMTATAVAADEVKLVAFNAASLLQLLDQDSLLGYQVMQALAKALSRRLLATRLQLLDLYHQ